MEPFSGGHRLPSPLSSRRRKSTQASAPKASYYGIPEYGEWGRYSGELGGPGESGGAEEPTHGSGMGKGRHATGGAPTPAPGPAPGWGQGSESLDTYYTWWEVVEPWEGREHVEGNDSRLRSAEFHVDSTGQVVASNRGTMASVVVASIAEGGHVLVGEEW